LYYCIVYSAIQPLKAASVLNKISSVQFIAAWVSWYQKDETIADFNEAINLGLGFGDGSGLARRYANSLLADFKIP